MKVIGFFTGPVKNSEFSPGGPMTALYMVLIPIIGPLHIWENDERKAANLYRNLFNQTNLFNWTNFDCTSASFVELSKCLSHACFQFVWNWAWKLGCERILNLSWSTFCTSFDLSVGRTLEQSFVHKPELKRRVVATCRPLVCLFWALNSYQQLFIARHNFYISDNFCAVEC